MKKIFVICIGTLCISLLAFCADNKTSKDNEDNKIFLGYNCSEYKLCAAMEADNLKEIKELIKNGADANEESWCYTALTAAVIKGNLDIVKELIKAGADVNKKVDCSEAGEAFTAPLEFAVSNKNSAIVEILLKAGADANVKNDEGYTPIQTTSDPEIIKILIKYGAEDSLYAASQRGDINAVKAYLKAGADVNAQNDDGRTPIFGAALGGYTEIVKLLLDNGADVNVEHKIMNDALGDNERYPLLIDIIKNAKTEIIKLILSAGVDVNVKGSGGDTALVRAVLSNNAENVETLLKAGADVNAGNDMKAIHWAAFDGNTKIAKLLIEAGADVNVKNRDGETPLALAIKYKHPEVVQLLQGKGAEDSIFSAIERNDVATVKRLIKEGADINATTSRYGGNVLLQAIIKGNAEIVKEIIKAGADVNAPYEDIFPLTEASKNASFDIVKLLLASGANVNNKNKYNQTALIEACGQMYSDKKEEYVNIVKALIQAGADVNVQETYYGNTALICATDSRDNLPIVQELIKAGAYVNVHEKSYGVSPLLNAVREESNPLIVKELVKAGANVNDRDGEGNTPLILAIYYDNLENVKTLINAKADVNLSRFDGWTPLRVASSQNKLEMAKLLLDAGANIKAQDNKGMTALISACDNGHIEMANLLLKAGAEDSLTTAAARRDLQAVKSFVSKGVDINVREKNTDADTALMFAAAFDYPEIVKFLIDKGANLNLRANNGKTALDYAKEKNNTEIVELLKSYGAKE